jgi:ABC-2 type transport system permease protein
LGAAWALPADVATGVSGGEVTIKLLISLAFLALLWLSWRALVARVLVTAQRSVPEREHANLGWFARTPSTRSGAVAARSFTYWARDARYPVPVIGVFGFLVVVFLAFVIAGIPLTYLVLLTVPALCATLAFSVHNDVALDNSAIWLHVSASRVGFADRLGRAVPVLAMGVPLIAVGSVAAAFFADDFEALPALLGVSTVLLLAGLGVGNLLSAVFPYPAVRPGDGPFSQPQVGGGTGFVVQICLLRHPRPPRQRVGVLAVAVVGRRCRIRRAHRRHSHRWGDLRPTRSRHPGCSAAQLIGCSSDTRWLISPDSIP